MIGQCAIATCSMPEETRKIHEEFEVISWNVCWECGDLLLDKIGKRRWQSFSKVIDLIKDEIK